MKRVVSIIILIMVLAVGFSLSVYSVDSNDLFAETEEKLYSIIDDDTLEVIDDIGINFSDMESLADFSVSSIIEYFSDDLKIKLQGVFYNFFTVITVVMFVSLVGLPLHESNSELFDFLSVCVIIILCFSKISGLISTLISVIKLSSDFLLGYIPIFAALIAMSGNVATALSYNTLLLSVSEISSRILSVAAEKITGVYLAVVICFSLNKNININRFVSSFSRYTSVVIGFISSLFVSFLTVKGVFSSNVDTVSAKGIRFVISSFVPVIGGAISEAYSTLIGSIGIVKSSVAIIGIAVSLIINIPVLFEGVCYCLSYNALSFMAEVMNSSGSGAILKAVSVGIKFLLLVQLFVMFILIISTAVMISIKSSV